MPWLEHNPATLAMHSLRHLLPGLRVALVEHGGSMWPFSALQGDEYTLSHYQTGTVLCSLGVVRDAGLSGLAVVDAAVARHGSHTDAVSED